MSTIKTATTVPKGQNQVIGAIEANGGAPLELPVKPLLPELVVGLRRGLTDKVEVGGKLTTCPARASSWHWGLRLVSGGSRRRAPRCRSATYRCRS